MPCRPIPHERLDPMEPLYKRTFLRKPRRSKKVRRWYWPHGVHYVADGGTSLLIPLFITNVLGGNVGHVGVVSAAGSMASVPASVGWGEMSDRLRRRKPFIIFGYAGAGALFILLGLSSLVEQFLVLSILLGIIGAASVPVFTLIITEMTEAKHCTREIGAFTWAGSIGWILGLLLGTLWLQAALGRLSVEMSMRLLFFFLGGVSMVSGLLAWKMVPEPPDRPFAPRVVDRLVILQGRLTERARFLPIWVYRWKYRKRATMHRIRRKTETVPSGLKKYFLASLLLYSGYQTIFTPFPIFLSDVLGASGMEIFAIYLLNSVASTAFYIKAGERVSEIGERRVLIESNVMRCLIFLGFAGTALLATLLTGLHRLFLHVVLLLLMVASGLFWAYVSVASTAVVSKCAPPETKGENIGIFHAVVALGGIAGSLAGGALALVVGYPAVFMTGAFLGALGVMLIGLNRGLDVLDWLPRSREWKEPSG